jgi:hypothetical protein
LRIYQKELGDYAVVVSGVHRRGAGIDGAASLRQ